MCDRLKKDNGHDRDKHVSFRKAGHVYNVDGKTDYLSVTKWISSHFPEFDADLTIRKMMTSPNWEKSKYFGKEIGAIKGE